MRMRCSRAVFARKLRINVRTLEKWEQGRAKPNPQAAALVLLVSKYPDTLERLEKVAAGGSSADETKNPDPPTRSGETPPASGAPGAPGIHRSPFRTQK